MRIDLTTYEQIRSPYYIIEEDRLRRNLALIKNVAERSGAEIILAFKAFALWKTFPIFREYISSTTASSLSEAMLAVKEFGSAAHTYSPAYTDDDIDAIARCSNHLTFNSLSQYERFGERVRRANDKISIGLRVNPEYSEVTTDLYNPCAPGTRLGVSADALPYPLPPDIEGLHCHCHCESGADVFVRTLAHIERKFGKWMERARWINFGGGHLLTRDGYDIDLFVRTVRSFRSRYPHLHVIFEPGSAFVWHTGPLVAQVVDIVHDKGIATAVLNVSFTCHMPDCLEMPYMPDVRGAKTITGGSHQHTGEPFYRLGGNSCLAGDYLDGWLFDHKLRVGENIIFEDMIHYTTVKTCMFNGISHPSIGIVRSDSNELETLRHYDYDDYRTRMD